MKIRLPIIAVLSWLISIVVWQLIFNSNSVLTPIIYEIHTIFTSVLIFFIVINYFLKQHFLDIIKIIFRIFFKVWFVIFIAFSMKKSFDTKGFLLSATFVFGYFEGLIDFNSWLSNFNFIFTKYKLLKTKQNRLLISVIFLSLIHILSAFIAFLFFDVL